MSLNDMANASNERRLQTIMRLEQMFRKQQVVTVMAAMQSFGVTKNTILKYCRSGDIPLFDTEKHMTVVPITDQNRPAWM
jgi:hypothetical protein